MSQRKRYSKDFKLKIIQLKESGVPRKQLLKDYDLKAQTFDRWLKEYRSPSNSSNPEITLTDEQKQIAKLERKLRQVERERDILKDAALILGRK